MYSLILVFILSTGQPHTEVIPNLDRESCVYAAQTIVAVKGVPVEAAYCTRQKEI